MKGEPFICFFIIWGWQVGIIKAVFLGIVANILGNSHTAKFRPAHWTKVCRFGAFRRKGFIMVFKRSFRIERQIELVPPAEFKARLGNTMMKPFRRKAPKRHTFVQCAGLNFAVWEFPRIFATMPRKTTLMNKRLFKKDWKRRRRNLKKQAAAFTVKNGQYCRWKGNLSSVFL